MPKTVGMDFYRVALPEAEKRSFTKIISELAALPDTDVRNMNHNYQPIRLAQSSVEGRRTEGEFVRIRMNHQPSRASIRGGPTKLLGLAKDEGVGEETAFLYDSGLQVLVLQRNHIGVSAAAFAQYFQHLGQVQGILELYPIVMTDELTKVLAMKRYTKLELSVAGFNNPEFIPGGEHGADVKAVHAIMKEYDAPSLSLTVSMGHKRGSLPPKAIRAALKRWLGIGKQEELVEVRKLTISGEADSPDSPDEINLFKFFMRETAELDEGPDRRLSYVVRKLALREALDKRRKEIVQLFEQSEQ